MRSNNARHLNRFAHARASILSAHIAGAGGFRTTRALSDAVDGLLRSSYSQLPHDLTRPYAVVALGGYGRKELCFGSDVDIMVLTPTSSGDAIHGEPLHRVMHAFLDLPLDLGHSTRSVEECLALAGSEFDAWLSLLDARYVCGNRGLFLSFIRALRASIRSCDTSGAIRQIIALSEARHAKHGRSTKLLEPNIKNSSGGVRDLHAVLWVLRATRRLAVGETSTLPAVAGMFSPGALRTLFRPAFLRQARAAADRLLHVRNEMHRSTGTLHDTLEFASQTSIAAELGYKNSARTSSAEFFMRDYYDAANTVAELHTRVMLWAQERWIPHTGRERQASFHGPLRVRSGRIHLHASSRPGAEMLLKAFLLRAETGAEFSFDLEDVIHRSLQRLRPIRSGATSLLFRQLFSRTGRTASSLRAMHRLGVLERWLPEWRPLVRFFQHNQYHYYTADEHTLRVIGYAESLENDPTVFGDAYRSLQRHDTLFFACLFHDITKPDRLDDHELSGARLARKVLERLGAHEIADDVAFLVQHHLAMEQIAFRRNISDPETLADFASRFPRPELLDFLLVLTFADLSAVNTNVLTDWKKSLLTDLYTRTSAVLRPGSGAPEVDVVRSDLARVAAPGQLAKHASLLSDEAYLRSFSRDTIVQHLRVLEGLEQSATTFQHWSEVTELTHFTHDAPFVLARSCGVLYANDLSIIDARIFTRDDGVVIDSFRVVDHLTNAPLTEDRCRAVEQDLLDVFSSVRSVDTLLEQHRRRWKRRYLHVNPSARTDVTFESHPAYTIVDVFGVDVPGFLFHVTDTLARLGCAIHAAKIATRGDGIVDAFYVRDADGRPIDDPARRAVVREAILARLAELYATTISPEHGA